MSTMSVMTVGSRWMTAVMVVLAMAGGLLAGGCGDSGATTAPAAGGGGVGANGGGAASALQIGLIVSGSTADGGWNQLAWEAVQKLATDTGAKVSKLEKVDTSKAAGEMRDYAQQGYDLVIGHGFEFADPAVEAAKTVGAGKTKFVVSGNGDVKPGVMTLDFDLSQPCYQLGIVAARVSKTGKLGFIGGRRFLRWRPV